MTGPLALGDPAARDPGVVGSKAALLALASDAGLPVLPGVVVPASTSAGSIAIGAAALAARGRAQAYLAASSVDVPPEVLEAVRSAGDPLVVRSSTALDDDGRWSGAFASYLDVGADDVGAAVRGCWASVFTRDALERCDATGIDPASLRVGVLAQPWVAFAHGGTARVQGDEVAVTVGRGGAHGVVGGGAATTIVVGGTGGVGDAADDPAGAPVSAVADLARRALDVSGIGAIEWGAIDDGVVRLLQIGPAETPSTGAAVRATPRRTGSMPADAARVAAIVVRFRGALGDELVLPWALGLGGPIDAAPAAVDDVEAAVAEARSRAATLTSSVWRSADPRRSADAAVRDLRGGAIERGLAPLEGLAAPDAGEARRIVALVRGIGAALEARGVLPAADVVWQLTPDELDAAVAGAAPASHAGPDRWEPFLIEAALAFGSIREGVPIADGVGGGRLHVVTSLRDIGRPGPRTVLAAPAPLPQLAPLLWHCAGFVASGGSAGAHLFEVAHSLGVPAVVGVAPGELGPPGSLVAVDGTAGIVASLGRGVDARRPA